MVCNAPLILRNPCDQRKLGRASSTGKWNLDLWNLNALVWISPSFHCTSENAKCKPLAPPHILSRRSSSGWVVYMDRLMLLWTEKDNAMEVDSVLFHLPLAAMHLQIPKRDLCDLMRPCMGKGGILPIYTYTRVLQCLSIYMCLPFHHMSRWHTWKDVRSRYLAG